MKDRLSPIVCAVCAGGASAVIFYQLFIVYWHTFFHPPTATLAIGYYFLPYRDSLAIFVGVLALRTWLRVPKKKPNFVLCCAITLLVGIQSYTYWGTPLPFCLWAMVVIWCAVTWMLIVDSNACGIRFGTL